MFRDLANKGEQHMSLQVIGEARKENRIYQLISFSIDNTKSMSRGKIISMILDQHSVIGLIEWWSKGSIARKPKNHFKGILIKRDLSQKISRRVSK